MKKGFKIPITDVQQQLDDNFRDQIELLNLKLEDAEETNHVLNDINASLTLRNAELQSKLEQEQQYRLKQSDNAYELNQALHKITKLEKDLTLEIGNRDHFRSLVAQQDAFLNEAKRQIQETKRKYEETLQARKNEVDHLAKQAVRLNEDLSKVKTDNCNFITETLKLREQVSALDCQTRAPGSFVCGSCVSCQLKQSQHTYEELKKTLDKRDVELSLEQQIETKRWAQICALVDAVDKFKKMSFFTWRQRRKLLQHTQVTINAFQADIDKLRKDFYKPKP